MLFQRLLSLFITRVLFGAFVFATIGNYCLAQHKKQLTIVTFGNSTTAPRAGINKVYAQRLKEKLDSIGIADTVFNAGIGGSHSGSIKDDSLIKIEHAMDRFERDVMNRHPDWVTLNFGLNDSWLDKGQNGPSRIPADKFKANLSYFIDKIKQQGGKVILLTPNPIGKKFEPWRYDRVKEYKELTQQLAKEKHVFSINSWELFYNYVKNDLKGIDLLLTDGIHPNDTGHRLIAEAIFKIINQSRDVKKYKKSVK